jgi:formate dehydrogenase maturation protein FdhE
LCPYCSLNDHNQLVALVPEKNESHGVVDACKRCLGYVKTFTTLQGCAATGVMLEDLATVALDVAVIEQGYTRRADAGYRLDVTVVSQNAPRPWATKLAERRRRFFAWNA